MRERADISYYFQIHPNPCLCERRRKTTSPIKLFWKWVFGKKKKKQAHSSFMSCCELCQSGPYITRPMCIVLYIVCRCPNVICMQPSMILDCFFLWSKWSWTVIGKNWRDSHESTCCACAISQAPSFPSCHTTLAAGKQNNNNFLSLMHDGSKVHVHPGETNDAFMNYCWMTCTNGLHAYYMHDMS